ncbi:MAG: hypothetical protein ABC596_05725 [Candidatus Methanosuratincola petrocarbonis]
MSPSSLSTNKHGMAFWIQAGIRLALLKRIRLPNRVKKASGKKAIYIFYRCEGNILSCDVLISVVHEVFQSQSPVLREGFICFLFNDLAFALKDVPGRDQLRKWDLLPRKPVPTC